MMLIAFAACAGASTTQPVRPPESPPARARPTASPPTEAASPSSTGDAPATLSTAPLSAAEIERELRQHRAELAAAGTRYAALEVELAATLEEVAALAGQTDDLARLAEAAPELLASYAAESVVPLLPPQRLQTTDNTNLRRGPDLTAERITVLPAGDEVLVLASAGDWRHVESVSGARGWVHSRLMVADGGAARPRTTDLGNLTTTDRVNVRGGPGLDHERIGRLELGDTVRGLAKDGDWYQIDRGDGAIGWVHGDYLVPADAPPL